MDLFSGLNYLAILCALASTIVIGILYYSPVLFAKLWLKLTQFKEEDLKDAGTGYLISMIGSFFSVFVMAILFKLLGVQSVTHGILYSSLIALGFVAPTMLLSVAFEKKSFALFFLNFGNMLISYITAGIILSAWK